MDSLRERVKIIPRKLIVDDRGWFLKAITGTEDNLPNQTGEVYLTMGKLGQSKGGHYHPKALEWFTIIEGFVILKLEDIFTKEQIQFPLSLSSSCTVFIPNNVAHIVVNNDSSDFILLAYTDLKYDPKDTIPYQFQK